MRLTRLLLFCLAIGHRLAAGLILVLWLHDGWTEVLEGRVVGVADGDTITILDTERQQHRIRLSGIDAPEKAQPYGARSKQHLSELAHGKSAKADCYKVDRYGRPVCTVFVDGKDIGLAQLDAGMAWWFRRYANEQLPRGVQCSLMRARLVSNTFDISRAA